MVQLTSIKVKKIAQKHNYRWHVSPENTILFISNFKFIR